MVNNILLKVGELYEITNVLFVYPFSMKTAGRSVLRISMKTAGRSVLRNGDTLIYLKKHQGAHFFLHNKSLQKVWVPPGEIMHALSPISEIEVKQLPLNTN